MSDLNEQLDRYYEKWFDKCCTSPGDPCGRERKKLNSGDYRPAALPAVGLQYRKGARRILFVGMNPDIGDWEKDKTPQEVRQQFTRYLDEEWDNRPFRKGLGRIARIAVGRTDPNVSDAEVLPFCAWTNFVKCAEDDGARGNPTWRMQINCGPKIWGELEILRPELLIALGDLAHVGLTEGAAHRGSTVRIPRSPWSSWWSNVEVAGKSVGVYSAYHPSDGRTINGAAKTLRDGEEPSQRISRILAEITRTDDPKLWRREIASEAGEDFKGDDLLNYIDRRFIAPGATEPPGLESGARGP